MCSSVWMFIMKKIKKTKKAKATVIKDHTRSAFVHKRFTLADIKRLLASLFWACNSWKDIFISLCSLAHIFETHWCSGVTALKMTRTLTSLCQNILDLNQGVVILWHYYPLRQQRRFSCFYCHFFTLFCADGPPSLSPCFWLLRRWCMLSHECEFAPASLLDLACLLTLSSSSQGCPRPPIRGLTPPAESTGEEKEEIMEPCGALMSCRAVRLREIINLDNLSRHNIVGSLSTLRTRADIRVTSLPPQVRADEGEGKTGEW